MANKSSPTVEMKLVGGPVDGVQLCYQRLTPLAIAALSSRALRHPSIRPRRISLAAFEVVILAAWVRRLLHRSSRFVEAKPYFHPLQCVAMCGARQKLARALAVLRKAGKALEREHLCLVLGRIHHLYHQLHHAGSHHVLNIFVEHSERAQAH